MSDPIDRNTSPLTTQQSTNASPIQPEPESPILTFADQVFKAAKANGIPLEKDQLEEIISTAEKVGELGTAISMPFEGKEVEVLILSNKNVVFLGKALGKGAFSQAREATHVTCEETTAKTAIVFKHSHIGETWKAEELYKRDQKNRSIIQDEFNKKGIEVHVLPPIKNIYQFNSPTQFGVIDSRFDSILIEKKTAETDASTPRESNENLQLAISLLRLTAAFRKIGWRHGDIKPQNIPFFQNNPTLGDLDGAKPTNEIQQIFEECKQELNTDMTEKMVENYKMILGSSAPEFPEGSPLEEQCETLQKNIDEKFEKLREKESYTEAIPYLISVGLIDIDSYENVDTAVDAFITAYDEFRKDDESVTGDTISFFKEYDELKDKNKEFIIGLLKLGFFEHHFKEKIEEKHFTHVYECSPKSPEFINRRVRDKAKEAFVNGNFDLYRKAEYQSDDYAMGLSIIFQLCGIGHYQTIQLDPAHPEAGFELSQIPELTRENYIEAYNAPVHGFKTALTGVIKVFNDYKSHLDRQQKNKESPTPTREVLTSIIKQVIEGMEKIETLIDSGKENIMDDIVEIHEGILTALNEDLEALHHMGEIAIKERLGNMGFNDRDIDVLLSLAALDPDRIPTADDASEELRGGQTPGQLPLNHIA